MKPEPLEDHSLNYTREDQISIPLSHHERRMAIRCSDWERLKRKLSRAFKAAPRLSIVYSILFGVAGSAGLSIIPIASSTGLPSWVTPLYVCIFILGLLSAFVFVCVDKGLCAGRESQIDEIKTDMKEIEAMFEDEYEEEYLADVYLGDEHL